MTTAAALNPASIRSLFAFCTTPAIASRASEKVFVLADKAYGRRANNLATLASALNEHRHMLQQRGNGNVRAAVWHSREVGRCLRSLGL